jgi:hypothetical protein
MGNQISFEDPNIIKKLETNKIPKKYIEIINSEKKLLTKLMIFYNQYKSIFHKNNLHDFYDAINIAYSPSLTSFTTDTLTNKYAFLYFPNVETGINNKSTRSNNNKISKKNSKLDLILRFRPNKNTPFLINTLRGSIHNYFFEKNIQWKNEDLALVHSPNSYIQSRILQLGGDGNNTLKSNEELKKELQQLQQREPRNYPPRDRNRDRPYPPRDRNRNRPYPPRDRNRDRPYPPRDRNRDRPYPPRNRDRPYPPRDRNYPPRDRNRDYEQPRKNNLLPESNNENKNDNENKNKNENNSNNNNNNNNNNSSSISQNIEIPKPPNKTPNEVLNVLQQIKPNSGIQTPTPPTQTLVAANGAPVVINDQLQKEIQNVILQNSLVKNKLSTREQNIQLIREKKTPNVFENKCTNANKICRLTKKEVIQKIIYYYQNKFFIILAILSFIQYYPNASYFFYRLKQIYRGEFCIPPNYIEVRQMSKKARLKYLLQYISHNSSEKCSAAAGFFRKLKLPLTMDSNVQQILDKLQKFYNDSLLFFNNVVDYLLKDRSIQIQQLNIISEKTRDILALLYTMCELYYLIVVSISLEKI